MQANANIPDRQGDKSSAVLTALGATFVACFFLFFTWRGFFVYYTGDDMMNLYGYWTEPVSTLVKQNVFFGLRRTAPSAAQFIALFSRPSDLIRTRSTSSTSRRC